MIREKIIDIIKNSPKLNNNKFIGNESFEDLGFDSLD